MAKKLNISTAMENNNDVLFHYEDLNHHEDYNKYSITQ